MTQKEDERDLRKRIKSLQEQSETTRKSNINIMVLPEGKKRENGIESQ